TEQMRQEDTDTALYENIQLVKDRLNGNPRYSSVFKFDETFIQSESLIDDFMDGKIDVIISYRNVFIDAYNEEIQKRKTGGIAIIADDDIILNKPVNSMVPTQIGDRQVWPIIKNNGDLVKVTHIHATQPEVGTIVEIDFGNPADRTRLLLTREQWATRSFVWELWLSSWKPIMPWKQFKRFAINASLPYAITTHKAQGSSYNNIGINLSDIAGAWKQDDMFRMQYVAMSRTKYKCYVKI
ncbi:MAG: ATP-binding domain-containing protein, partial [Caldisericia bacterium]|nr:ATP-binding domain-containing protein [Caldisericia bacterium]